MKHGTGIPWTHVPGYRGETLNDVVGCEMVSSGCGRCYAKTLHDMRHEAKKSGAKIADQYDHPFEKIQLISKRMETPFRTRIPRAYFDNSVSDLFHEDVPFEFIAAHFGMCAGAPDHLHMILTKRPDRMLEFQSWLFDSSGANHSQFKISRDVAIIKFLRAMLKRYCPEAEKRWQLDYGLSEWPLRTVGVGVSTENQAAYDYRVPRLLQFEAWVRFVSAEPLLDIIDYQRCTLKKPDITINPLKGCLGGATLSGVGVISKIDWLIIGGESARPRSRARMCKIEGIRLGIGQCRIWGTPVFVKQFGSRPHYHTCANFECDHPDCGWVPIDLRHPMGEDMTEWPFAYQIREFPKQWVHDERRI